MKKFKILILKADFTQEELAKKLGTSQQNVSRWAQGCQPDYYYLPQMSEALGVNIETIVRAFLPDEVKT